MKPSAAKKRVFSAVVGERARARCLPLGLSLGSSTLIWCGEGMFAAADLADLLARCDRASLTQT
ncbi:MAG: hypothetical protein AAFY53_03415 [Pseudomonadota bacterium]